MTGTWVEVSQLVSRGWCRGYMAVDDQGIGVGWNDIRACKFCLLGAILRITEGRMRQTREMMEELYEVLPEKLPNTITTFNDNSTQEEVMCLVNLMIEKEANLDFVTG